MHGRKEQVENGKVQEQHTDLEDALYQTGTGKFHILLLLICGLGLAGVMLETFISSFLLPSVQCDFHLSSSDKAKLNALYPIGIICGSHTWGYLADTRGRKKVLVASFFLDGLCAILSSFTHALWLLLVFRFLCGFVIVGASSVIYPFMGEFHSQETRSKALIWLSVFYGLGIAIQPGIAWLIIPVNFEWHLPWCVYKSWRLFIIVCALPNLLSGTLLALYLPETPKFLLSRGKKEEALQVLKHMYSKNTGNSENKYPVKSVILIEDDATEIPSSQSGSPLRNLFIHMWNQTVPLFKPPFLWKTLLACFVQYGLYASTNGLSMWLPDIFNKEAAYYATHIGSHPSICDILNEVQEPVNATNVAQSIDLSSLEINKLRKLDLNKNDSLVFSCENSTLILNINNSTEFLVDPGVNSLICQNDRLLYSLSEMSINIEQDGTVVLTVLNTSVASHLLPYDTGESSTYPVIIDEFECNRDIDTSAFKNTLIIGATAAISLVIIVFLIDPLGKKPIIIGSLLTGGIAGLMLNVVNANWEFFIMALAFVNLSGMCIVVMVSAVVDIFPTNLRAMVVCLSLMCGRMGSITTHMLMGELLEGNCVIVTYFLGGLCTSCGLVAFLLPSPRRNN